MLLLNVAKAPPPNIIPQILPRAIFLQYNFIAVIVSICFFAVSVPIITFFLMVHFEKTQVQEYVYFIFFLAGCLTELTRLFIPVFDLWNSNSSFLISSTRLLLFGRTLAPASFLFPALFSVSRQNQETGRNVIILIALAGIFALFIPVNTAHIMPDCTVEIGYRSLLSVFTMAIYLLSLLSLLIASQGAGREQKLLAVGYALFFAGYLILTGIQPILMLAIGIILFVTGVYLYLRNLQQLYMWK
jgi:hypothetical protein